MLKCKSENETLVMFYVHNKKEHQAQHFRIMPDTDFSGFLKNEQQTYTYIQI